jgi:cytochrome oxidase Cu insertion factor (SCO1/SenC/PrrC family)
LEENQNKIISKLKKQQQRDKAEQVKNYSPFESNIDDQIIKNSDDEKMVEFIRKKFLAFNSKKKSRTNLNDMNEGKERYVSL